MQMILHTPEEIKGTTWQKVQRQLGWLNKHLTQALTADDPEWRAIEREHYLKLLPAVHVNGAAGSLLDQGDDPVGQPNPANGTREEELAQYRIAHNLRREIARLGRGRVSGAVTHQPREYKAGEAF